MKKVLLTILIFSCLFVIPSFSMSSTPINGLWWNQAKSAQIEIYESAGRIFGKIVFLKEPAYPPDDPMSMAGRSKVDRNNPDPLKRKQPLLGLQILGSFRQTGDRLWEEGFIYDPMKNLSLQNDAGKYRFPFRQGIYRLFPVGKNRNLDQSKMMRRFYHLCAGGIAYSRQSDFHTAADAFIFLKH